jgi:hypothetical protein
MKLRLIWHNKHRILPYFLSNIKLILHVKSKLKANINDSKSSAAHQRYHECFRSRLLAVHDA